MNSLWTFAGTLALPVPALAQSDDGSVGLLCGCYGLILLGYFALVAWVYSDASGRGNDKAGLWALLVFFTPVIGLIIYFLIGRDQGTPYPSDSRPPPTRWPEENNTRRF